jgi:Prophage protein (DUF1660)
MMLKRWICQLFGHKQSALASFTDYSVTWHCARCHAPLTTWGAYKGEEP